MSDVARETVQKPEIKKIGLLSMGIMLTVAGCAMLLGQLGWVNFDGYQWLLPAYLIVVGIETLVTRLILDRKAPDMHLSPAVGSVAITLAALLFIRLWSILGSIGTHMWFRW